MKLLKLIQMKIKPFIFVAFYFLFPFFLYSQNIDTTCICGEWSPDENIPTIVEIVPSYPGGNKALLKLVNSNVKFDKTDNGKITISFIIGCTGKTCGFSIASNKSNLPKETELRILEACKKMELWKPAKQMNKPINVPYQISLTFTKGFASINTLI